MTLLSNLKYLFVLRVGAQLVTLVMVMYLTRNLAPGELGVYFYFGSVIGASGILAALGTTGAAEKRISEADAAHNWYAAGLLATIGLSLLAGFAIYALNEYVFRLLPADVIPLFVVGLLAFRLADYYRHVLRAELRAALDGLLNFVRVVVLFGVAVAVVRSDLGAVGLIAGWVLSQAVLIPIGAVLTRSTYASPTAKPIRNLFSYGKYYAVHVVGSKVFYYADVIFIGALLTPAAVGRYEVAWRIVLAAIFVNGIVAKTSFSYISRSHSLNDWSAVARDVERGLRYVLIIPLGLLAGGVTVGTEVLDVLFTPEYAVSRTLFVVLCVGFVFQALYFLFSQTLFAVDEPELSFYATVVAIACNVGLNLLLIPQFGMLGAAVATTGSYVVATVAYYGLLWTVVEVPLPLGRFGRQTFAATAMLLLLYSVKPFLHARTPAHLAGLILLGGTVYVAILVCLKQTRDDIVELATG